MNIAKFCIRHKVTTLLAVIMIAVFGVVYTTQLQMALLPNIEYPAAYVYCLSLIHIYKEFSHRLCKGKAAKEIPILPLRPYYILVPNLNEGNNPQFLLCKY